MLKWTGREANHSPRATEVKNYWSLSNTPHVPLFFGRNINKIDFVEQ